MAEFQKFSEDDRYEIAMVAAASERRNRPKNLIMIPVGLFVVASLVLAFALYSVESGRVKLDQQEYRYNELVKRVVQIKELEQAGLDKPGSGNLEPVADFLSRAEGYAREAGIDPVPLPQPRRDRQRGFVRVRYSYTGVTNQDLTKLFDWLRITQDRIPGTHIYALTLKPAGVRGWTMDVQFARWERGE